MGQKLGMDPDAIRAVAAKLRAQERVLASAVHGIDMLVEQSRQVWMGSASASFTDRWYGGMRAQLAAAEQAIAGLATSAARQADQQQQVSSTAGAGVSGGASVLGGSSPGRVSSPGDLLGSISGAAGNLAGRVPDAAGEGAGIALGAMGVFAQNKFHSGRYTKGWPAGLHFKKWEVMQALGRQQANLKLASKGVSYLGLGTDAFGTMVSLKDGDHIGAAAGAMDTAADIVGDGARINAPGRLVSNILHLTAFNIREARHIDVAGIPSTLDYASKNLGVVGEEFGKATVTVGIKMIGWNL